MCSSQLLERSHVAVTRLRRKRDPLQVYSAEDNVDMEDDDTELFAVCSEIAAEADLLASVHEALALWESCFQDDVDAKKSVVFCDRKLDWIVSLDYIEVLVMIYKLMEVDVFHLIFFVFFLFYSCFMELLYLLNKCCVAVNN